MKRLYQWATFAVSLLVLIILLPIILSALGIVYAPRIARWLAFEF